MQKFIGALLLATLAGCVNQRMVPVRPVAVNVLDRESGKPLQGIRVYYTLHTMVVKRYILFVIPSLEPDIGPKLVYKASGTTDKDGKILFHAKDFVLPGNERFEIEEIIVNIDADMASHEAQSLKETLEYYYGKDRVFRRDAPVDNIDIVERCFIEDRETRDKVLFHQNASYGGAIIISNAYPPYGKGDEGWFAAEEHISRTFNGNSLAKEKDVITVYLNRI